MGQFRYNPSAVSSASLHWFKFSKELTGMASISSSLPVPLDVIAVGAHPDDVEIACGGTLARMVQQGLRVGIVDLTDGEPTPLSPGPEVRLEEAVQAAKILGVQIRETLELPNRRLFDTFEARVELAKVFRRYRPQMVLGIADKTPMASPDHWQAMQITDAAVFYSRLTKWEETFDNLPVHRIQRQVWYPLGLQNLSLPEGGGRFVSDISDTLDAKIAAIRCYQTQFPPDKQRVFQLVESQNRLLGTSAGFDAGEMLICTTTLGLTDVFGTLCGRRDGNSG
jgi:bacillithiol biosynthesis deacetylase BshB1